MTVSEEMSDEEDMLIKKPKASDWVLVKYAGKKTIKRFVGQVQSVTCDGVIVKFARKVDGSKFKWPIQDDIATIDEDQIEIFLRQPRMIIQNDRVTGFTFKIAFGGLTIE